MILEKKRKRRRLGQRGFTFVELLVAVAILGVCVAPIVSTFIVTARINLKGRQKEQALTVAQNIVEGVKAFGIEKTVEVCKSSNTSDFTLVPENAEGSTKISHTIVSSTYKSSTIDVGGYEYWDHETFAAGTTITTKSYEYTIKIENILLGYAYYDAVVTIKPNYDLQHVAGYVFEPTFSQAGMSNLKYYDVVCTVTMHGQSTTMATYDGTFVDQK